MSLRRLTNSLATGVITTGGITLIVIVVGILVFIFLQTWPLWTPAETGTEAVVQLRSLIPDENPEDVLMIGEEEQKEIMYLVTRRGRLYFVSLPDGKLLKTLRLPLYGEQALTSAVPAFGSHHLAFGTSDGRVAFAEIKFHTLYEKGHRTIVPEMADHGSILTDSLHRPVLRLGYTRSADTDFLASLVASSVPGTEIVVSVRSPESSVHHRIPSSSDEATALAWDAGKHCLYIGRASGALERWIVPSEGPAHEAERIAVATNAVSHLAFLIGDITLIAGTDGGSLTAWRLSPDDRSGTSDRQVLTRVRSFWSHAGRITSVVPSWRNKCFLSTDESGHLLLQHSTSEQLLLQARISEKPIIRLAYSPKGDGCLILDRDGRLFDMSISAPHPEVSASTLWSKNLYESYREPTYTWQSTGGTDDFEPKLSLIPLIFGTIKGTLYAMIFAIPLAVMGALYTSQFAHPRLRNLVKPIVEIMAALPSVVIGFMAGLWLAPLMKTLLVSILVGMLLVPLTLVVFVYFFEKLPKAVVYRFKFGHELVIMMPALVLAVWLSTFAGSYLESAAFGGDAVGWLYTAMDVSYDQRNCLVVGIALAFASMPIIFTITEDSLSSVPAHLTSASLALGATRWQTAMKVILPAASAGIFSAVMIGFGRAVGETMIVLMATGNTPIMDWSIFNGMRTLSANIAVEIPEAPHGGTLYRVLFLSGLILFMMTFVVNTLAEVVRQRLRNKYASL